MYRALVIFIFILSFKDYKLCNAAILPPEMPMAAFEESDEETVIDITPKRPSTAIDSKKLEPIKSSAQLDPVSDFNYRIQFWNKKQILEEMKKKGFVDIDDLNIITLKEIRMAHYYDRLLWDMNKKTGLGIGVIWAFLRIEAYSSGVNESALMRNGWNFGGIKYRKNIHPGYVLAKDDCGSNKCRFAKFNSYEEGVEAWAKVFNAPRYASAKSQKNAIDIFYQLYKGGYHTHNNVKQRKALRDKYWSLRKHFPKEESKNWATFPDQDDFYESADHRKTKREKWMEYVSINKAHALRAKEKYGVPASFLLAEGLILSNCGLNEDHFQVGIKFGSTRDAYMSHARAIKSKGIDYAKNSMIGNKIIHVIEDLELYKYD